MKNPLYIWDISLKENMVNCSIVKSIFSTCERNSNKLVRQSSFFRNTRLTSVFTEHIEPIRNNGSQKQNWFLRLFSISHNKYAVETKKYLTQEITNFYKETRDISDIVNFETNKSIITECLKKKPEELLLTKKEYKEFIDFIKQKGLICDINLNDLPSDKYKRIYKELKSLYEVKWEDAEQIYYKQEGMLNPDLVAIKSKIEPNKVSLGKFEDKVPHLAEIGDNKRYTLDEVKSMLNESRGITLEKGSLLKEHYATDDVYDLPFKFASASYNSLASNGNAYINIEIPKLFHGINEKELYESLDLISTHVRGRIMRSFPKGSVLKLKIGGKDFECTSLGHGLEGNVFRISAKGEKPVILKTYFADSDRSRSLVSFAPSGLYGGLGILREANIAKVVDVPQLYMANPIYKPISGADSIYMGAWQIVEDATTRKSIGEGLKFRDWLKQKGLIWRDDKTDAWINNVCVDTGFITASGKKSYLEGCWGDSGINRIYSRYLNGESTEQILNFLNSTV